MELNPDSTENGTFFNEMIGESRLLEVLHDNLSDETKSNDLYFKICHYFEKYAVGNGLTPQESVEIYYNFITQFNKHCKQFIKTGNYPIQNGEDDVDLERIEYDIVLLLSVLFTEHRFRIMELIDASSSAEKALFIGLGPGLELYLTKDRIDEVHTYDLSVSPFLEKEFSDVQLNSELYTGQNDYYYDTIYLIELLEHIEAPIDLLRTCYNSLKKGGEIYLTTATDIPQFDHLYNFPVDHSDFEEEVKNIGFTITSKEMIPHKYLTMEIAPCNHFYTLRKT